MVRGLWPRAWPPRTDQPRRVLTVGLDAGGIVACPPALVDRRRPDRRGSGRRCRDSRSRSRTRRCHGPDRPSCPTRRRSRCGGGRSSRRPRRTRLAPRRPSSAAQAARRTTTGPGRAATAAAAFRPGLAGFRATGRSPPGEQRGRPRPRARRRASARRLSTARRRCALARLFFADVSPHAATPLSRSEGIGAPAPHSGGARMCTSDTLRARIGRDRPPGSHRARYVALGEKFSV